MLEALAPIVAEAYQPAKLEEINSVSAWLHALGKESPAKAWWEAPGWHPAIGRALRIDRREAGAVYALAPFRLLRLEDRHVIAAAWPAPRMLDDPDFDWLGIESVIAWDPVGRTTEVLGDPAPQIVGTFTNEPALFGDTHAFFVAWARRRAVFFQRWLDSRTGKWAHTAPERDEVPGCLAVGALEKIRWSPASLPETLNVVGLDAGKLNKVLLKAARVPRAVNAPSPIREAA
jgi:hypothetical protein